MYWDFRKWIYLDIKNPFKTMNKLKGVFKPLKRYFKYSFKEWDYYPVLWCSKPAYIHIMFHDVMWKDKYDTPRFEVAPYIWIHIYKMNLVWYWSYPKRRYLEDEYWEQALWYLYYSNSDIKKAKKTWPWIEFKSHKSTWKNKYLL